MLERNCEARHDKRPEIARCRTTLEKVVVRMVVLAGLILQHLPAHVCVCVCVCKRVRARKGEVRWR